jgi:TRAP-type C4-dicarboxylate transport system permease small subunit
MPAGRPAATGAGGWIHVAARGFAVAAGLLLGTLALLVVASVTGRALLGRPIPGDFEIVAIGMAVAVCLCLPWCHVQRGNVVVEIFPARASPRFTRLLDGVSALLYAAIAALFAVRMTAGLVDVATYQDISVILGIPLWWAYPPAVASFALLAAACVSTALGDPGHDTA